MKNLLIISLMVSSMALFGCNNADASKNETTNNSDSLETTTGVSDAKPVHLTKQDFLDKVMNYEVNPNEWIYKGDKPCIIDFYADWCRPCKMAAPVLDEIAKEYSGKITVYKIDTQKEQELAAVFGIQSIPAFLLVPVKGKPQMFAGIGSTPQETKAMFTNAIEQVLLAPATE